MEQEMNLPSVLGIFNGGYAPEMIRMLLDSIPAYVSSFANSDMMMGRQDAENVNDMVMLLRAILKDCYNIDLD